MLDKIIPGFHSGWCVCEKLFVFFSLNVKVPLNMPVS